MIARNWWPVAVWLGVIRLESTNFASAGNTFHLLYRVLFFFFGRIDPRLVWQLDHWLRKSGHFLGYAILSGLTFLALRKTYRDCVTSAQSWGSSLGHWWRLEWSVIAVGLTVVTAALDELHQASLPSRTGRWQDVVIDTSGALVLQIVIYLGSRLRFAHRGRQYQSSPAVPATRPKPSLLESK